MAELIKQLKVRGVLTLGYVLIIQVQAKLCVYLLEVSFANTLDALLFRLACSCRELAWCSAPLRFLGKIEITVDFYLAFYAMSMVCQIRSVHVYFFMLIGLFASLRSFRTMSVVGNTSKL